MAIPKNVAASEIGQHAVGSDSETGVDRGVGLPELVHDPDGLPPDLHLAEVERDREERVLSRETKDARAVDGAPPILDQHLRLAGTRVQNRNAQVIHLPLIPDGPQEEAAIAGEWTPLRVEPASGIACDGKPDGGSGRASTRRNTHVAQSVLVRADEVSGFEPDPVPRPETSG